MSVSKAEYDAYVRTMDTVSSGAQNALLRLWDKLDKSDIDSLREDMLRYLPEIIERYGKASAVTSARFYERVRASYIADESFVAVTGGSMLDNKKLKAGLLYALSDDFEGESVTGFISGLVDLQVKNYGRMTMQYNAQEDDNCKGYISVPSGDACAFCIMKAIGTYYNYQGETLLCEVDVDAWHANCNCQLLPTFGSLPSWWKGMASDCQDMYEAGVDQAWKDTRDDRQQRIEEYRKSPEYAENQKTSLGRLENFKYEQKLEYEMTAKEVLSGMRTANGLEH